MAMEISKSFVVKASPEAVWRFLTDPVRVARCLPGAAITGQIDERTHAGTITVKVGPVTATYKGTMRFERLDPATRTAEIVGNGQEVRGKGGADMRMTSTLVERAPGETEVTITSQVNVMGILAQFGRGMIQDVSDQMFGTFVAAARAELEKPETSASMPANNLTSGPANNPASVPASAPPIDLLSTGSAAAVRAAVRAGKRAGVIWVGIVIALALLLFWLR